MEYSFHVDFIADDSWKNDETMDITESYGLYIMRN